MITTAYMQELAAPGRAGTAGEQQQDGAVTA
jgi:hypothetical protein